MRYYSNCKHFKVILRSKQRIDNSYLDAVIKSEKAHFI